MDKDYCRRKYRKMRCALLHLLLIVGGATGLKDLTINVPAKVRSGDTVTLSCHYDLEGLPLYNVQWFLNDNQFYRYSPENPKPYSIYDVAGIQVNISKSNSHDVTLVRVSRNLTGMYKCEVSDAITFHTLIERAKMEVVDAPKTDPMIRTEKERITVGETLRVNCTSGNSRPASTVTWKLNGEPIEDNTIKYKIRSYKYPHEEDTESTNSLIEFRVTTEMFRYGHLHLRCTASIADVYRKSADIDISEDVPRIASITGESPPYNNRANGCAGQNWPWNGNRGAAIIMATVAATLFLMMTSLTMTVPPITNVLPRSEPAVISR
ncbi:cell adhesion molecule 2 [Linepithema humile]|uniref:cell adhesion molecule 2 n=1 Tax=Linepithema humile TaxID=83485 RepID=UPI000623252A|nr:PREDICTED: uncharacterized protein LOC105672592 [Linepithema humile]